MSGRWDTYLGHDRPLPMGEQSHREYHSGDPGPDHECPDCGGDVDDEEMVRCDDCRDAGYDDGFSRYE